MHHITHSAARLLDAVATGLRAPASPNESTTKFIETLTLELKGAVFDVNPDAPRPLLPPVEVKGTFEALCRGSDALSALRELCPTFSWFSAERFYPAPENQSFSRRIWGATVVGQDDAPITVNDRFIALLMLVLPGTTYPLHSHRIEELYYVLAGEAEWSHEDASWERLVAGDTFFNSSYQPHSIRTAHNPVLALGFYLPPFGWEGGLVQ